MALFDFIEDKEVRTKVEEAHRAAVQTAVDTEVSGLKTKNEELLNEKKSLQQKFDPFKDLNIETVTAALTFKDEHGDSELFKKGELDEIINKKTSKLKTDHETVVTELQTTLKTEKDRGDKYKGLYHTKLIQDGIRKAALETGVRPEALIDVLSRGNTIFTLGEDGELEARDKNGKLRTIGEDDIIMTPKNWVESLKTTAPHYWPSSEGLDAGSDATDDDLLAAMEAAAAKGDMKKFRELRDKRAKRKGKK